MRKVIVLALVLFSLTVADLYAQTVPNIKGSWSGQFQSLVDNQAGTSSLVISTQQPVSQQKSKVIGTIIVKPTHCGTASARVKGTINNRGFISLTGALSCSTGDSEPFRLKGWVHGTTYIGGAYAIMLSGQLDDAGPVRLVKQKP
jgi:hypothetical protein